MASRKTWYLLVDRTPKDGSWNMAVDEFLFREVKEAPLTFLRFYTWSRPTASLGYYQKTERVVDLEVCRRQGVDIVRRMTGGKLVLHHEEVTYTVASSEVDIFSTSLRESYRLVSEALILGLKRLGLEAHLAAKTPERYARGDLPCFSFPAEDEIEIKGKKLIGSAQKRVGQRFLQHGSIPLRNNASLLQLITPGTNNERLIRMISLEEALGRVVEFDEVVAALISGFSEYFNAEIRPKVLTEKDREKIYHLEKEKYGNTEWIFQR
ncbi:lipoate--protein ligase family protein [Candidatus Aminicenantes bacterium AC-334-K16]|jgi:lipoate-protein ligase A|nr:lipoate--protein ligase family protein [Candidatus Aminicenantes bacterium AC-334-K16]